MTEKKSLSGKTQGIWKFCQNTGNFAVQVANSMILKIQNIAILLRNYKKNSFETECVCEVSFAQEIVANYIGMGKILVGQGKYLKIEFQWGLYIKRTLITTKFNLC